MLKSLKTLNLIIVFLALLIVGCARNEITVSRDIAGKVTEESLPLGVQKLLYSEQVLLSRAVNKNLIISPQQNAQESFYKPENRNVFELKTYWIKESDLFAFTGNELPSELKDLMVRENNGIREWRLIVHPESEAFYASIIKKGKPGSSFNATSTSSSRTLVVWPPENPDLAFFGKLSLDKKVGGAVRTIPQREIANSMGVSRLLKLIGDDLPKGFHYLPESIGIVPKEYERGGMIIRTIPDEVKKGDVNFAPLFSLYGICKNCKRNPLIVDMINKSGMGTDDFVREKIFTPFLDQWFALALQGIVMEPHAQNVLIGFGDDLIPNGEFLHRDFGGFNIDFKLRKDFKMKMPKHMPVINSIENDYHQKSVNEMIESSLHTYFVGGFVYNLDENLSSWARQKLIPAYQKKHSKTFFQDMFFSELGKRLGMSASDVKDKEKFKKAILKLQQEEGMKLLKSVPSDADCFGLVRHYFKS